MKKRPSFDRDILVSDFLDYSFFDNDMEFLILVLLIDFDRR